MIKFMLWKPDRLVFLLILAITWLAACQNPTMETTPLDENLVFTSNSQLAGTVANVLLLDGSRDNIFDNASCLSIVFPFTATLNGERIDFSTQAQIDDLTSNFDQNPQQRFELELTFPITVVNERYNQTIVNDMDELSMLANSCINGGGDQDIECIDFEYPLSLATYDRLNQIASVQELRSDEDFFFFLERFSGEDLLGFTFPFNVTSNSGEVFTIRGNNDFEQITLINGNNCDEDDRVFEFEVPQPLTQTLSIRLTDAPFPIEQVSEVNINIFRVEVQTDESNGLPPFIILSEEEVSTNLLSLNNGITLLLSQSEIPVGTYTSFRVFVEDGTAVLTDGEVFDLRVPSGSQSGIKINLRNPLVVSAGQSTEILFDFDVSKSLVARGNPNSPMGIMGFNFRPVINAAIISESGSLSGSVRDIVTQVPLEDSQLSVFAADTLFTSTFTNEDGNFKILGLPPGNYSITGERAGYLPLTLSAEITVQQESVLDFELTPE